jgi:hypothetical protein
MYAILDYDNVTVIGVSTPDVPLSDLLKETKGRIIIEVNDKTGNGYLPGYYFNNKFYQGTYKGEKMGRYAVIENELVVNVIAAESQQIADEVLAATLPNDIAIEINNDTKGIQIGWTYKNDEFIPPVTEGI